MKRHYASVAGWWSVALLAAGCGGSTTYIAPAEPEATVRGFMNAVRSNSLVAMGELWGTGRGPAVSYMDREELDKRLTVMQSILRHESFEILPANEVSRSRPDERVLQVRLLRGNCAPVVPFTLIRYRSGWLVNQIDLEAAGNPARRCR